MFIQTTFTRISRNLLDLLFPVLCFNCGYEGSYLCRRCRSKLKRCEFQLCIHCGKRSPFGLTHKTCRQTDSLDGLLSVIPYKQPIARRLVESLKYGLVTDIAKIFGELIYEEICNQAMQIYFRDFILVPIPLHSSRLRFRGFNQSELIANKLSQFLTIPVNTTLLKRGKKTRTQTELSDVNRELNVKQAFQSISGLDNQRIILVDDVCTTGATISEACKALKQNGAKEVWGCVFAQG